MSVLRPTAGTTRGSGPSILPAQMSILPCGAAETVACLLEPHLGKVRRVSLQQPRCLPRQRRPEKRPHIRALDHERTSRIDGAQLKVSGMNGRIDPRERSYQGRRIDKIVVLGARHARRVHLTLSVTEKNP